MIDAALAALRSGNIEGAATILEMQRESLVTGCEPGTATAGRVREE